MFKNLAYLIFCGVGMELGFLFITRFDKGKKIDGFWVRMIPTFFSKAAWFFGLLFGGVIIFLIGLGTFDVCKKLFIHGQDMLVGLGIGLVFGVAIGSFSMALIFRRTSKLRSKQ